MSEGQSDCVLRSSCSTVKQVELFMSSHDSNDQTTTQLATQTSSMRSGQSVTPATYTVQLCPTTPRSAD